MKRILITGASGTVRSTAIEALAERGYKAFNADDDGLSDTVSVFEDERTGPGRAGYDPK